MRKLLGIVVLGLLVCNVSFAAKTDSSKNVIIASKCKNSPTKDKVEWSSFWRNCQGTYYDKRKKKWISAYFNHYGKIINKTEIAAEEVARQEAERKVAEEATAKAKKEPAIKPEEKKKLSKNFIAVNFCIDGAGYSAISNECPTSYTGTKSITTTYEVFLTKVKKPICYSKKEDRVQVRTRCNKSREQYEVKHDGKNFYWSSEETQIAKKEPTQTEDKTKKQATVTSETSSSDNNYRELVKKFGSECESSWSNFFTGHKVGTPEFDQCLAEKQNEQIKLAKLEEEKLKTEKEIYLSLSPEEKRAYTCANTFGFKKGSDKFRDCIFKIYATELELAKLEVEKQLAEALLATAKANVEAAQAKVAAAKAEGLLQKAQIQAVEAQAAATKQQAAASKAQAAATNQQSSISLMLQGLQMLQPTQTQSSFNTTCTWMGNFMNCW